MLRRLPLNGRSVNNVIELLKDDDASGDDKKNATVFKYPFAESVEEQMSVINILSSELSYFDLHKMGFNHSTTPVSRARSSKEKIFLDITTKEMDILGKDVMLNDVILHFFVIWYVRL